MTLHRGKIATNPKIIEVRPLTREDLACLRQTRVSPNAVSTFKDSHHRIARLIASGLRPGQVAELCGYSLVRISTLAADPAFVELVATYRDKVDDAFAANADHFYDLLKSNASKAERMIADRLDKADETGEELPVKTLLSISRDSADRVGYGKNRTNMNVNVDLGNALERAIARSGRANVIDAKPAATQAIASMPPPERARTPSTPVGIPATFRRRA